MLTIKNLKKSYGSLTAVDHINLEIMQGEIFGLLGPNGAGKSTTISSIATLLKADEGEILMDGAPIEKDLNGFKKRIGIVPQDIALYPMLTGLENLKFWGSTYGLKGKKLMARIDVVSEIIGISERLSSKVETYSGGMKRRLNIGAALLHEPDLLIMDEPTVGIDPQSRNHILEAVKRLNKDGMTIIYTSHYMEEVEFLCDRLAIIDHGKIIAQGSKNEITNSLNQLPRYIIEINGGIKEFKALFDNCSFKSTYDEESQLICLESSRQIETFSQLATLLEKEELSNFVKGISIEKPSLETVFLKLTGRSLRD